MSKPKKFEVVHPYKQLRALCMSAPQVSIFPTELRPIFRFFLKSRKAKKFEISPKTYSTAIRDWLMALLYLSLSGVGLEKGLVNGHIVDRPGRDIGMLVLDISYKSVVQVVVGGQSMQAWHCHDDILQQGHRDLLLFY